MTYDEYDERVRVIRECEVSRLREALIMISQMTNARNIQKVIEEALNE